jgi:hypothetical protein
MQGIWQSMIAMRDPLSLDPWQGRPTVVSRIDIRCALLVEEWPPDRARVGHSCIAHL